MLRSGDDWLLADAVGSVRNSTSDTGAVTNTSAFTAFGEPIDDADTFGFAGEQLDTTGLIHLRVRQLDPTLGRFLSVDPIQPGGPSTTGWNHYTYAGANPTTWTDPTGQSVLLEYGAGVGEAADRTDIIGGPLGQCARTGLAVGALGLERPDLVGPQPGVAVLEQCGRFAATSYLVSGGVVGGLGILGNLVRQARLASPGRPGVALDTNAIIAALEGGDLAAVDRALIGRRPLVSPTAVDEFLAGNGSLDDLGVFLRDRGGLITREASPSTVASLQAELDAFNATQPPGQARVLRPGDACVVAAACDVGVPLLTRDDRLARTLEALGIPVEGF